MSPESYGLFVGFDDGFLLSAAESFGRVHPSQRWPFKPAHSSTGVLAAPPLVELHLTAWRDRHRCGIAGQLLLAQSVSRLDEIALMCDRVFVRPVSNQDQQLYLGRLIELLASFVDGEKIEYCVFSATPHFAWDGLLALLMRRQGVPVFSLGPTQIDQRIVVRQFFKNLSDSTLLTRTSFGTQEVDSIANLVRTDVVGMDRARSTRLSNAGRLLEPSGHAKSKSLRSFLARIPLGLGWRRTVTGLAWSKAIRDGNYFWVMRRGSTTVLGVVRKFQLFWHLRLIRKLAVGWPNQAGVLFLLHFQPERSTDPEAGVRRHQVTAVRELRALLDACGLEEMPIFVREHPRQLSGNDPDFRKILTRSASFYREICLIQNVFLLDPHLEWQEKLGRWKLVVSVNGSGAWEAAIGGRPSITFVRTWHSGCTATPVLDTVQDQRLMKSLLEMSADEVKEALSLFLREEVVTHAGSMDNAHVRAEDAGIVQEDLVKLFVRLRSYVTTQKSSRGGCGSSDAHGESL